ncbi:hypothetical protein OROGR_024075 [Orobanche gracilis]
MKFATGKEIAQLLISSANDPERVKRMLETIDIEGDTPLHHAARGEYADAIRLLLAYGASPNLINVYGKRRGYWKRRLHVLYLAISRPKEDFVGSRKIPVND